MSPSLYHTPTCVVHAAQQTAGNTNTCYLSGQNNKNWREPFRETFRETPSKSRLGGVWVDETTRTAERDQNSHPHVILQGKLLLQLQNNDFTPKLRGGRFQSICRARAPSSPSARELPRGYVCTSMQFASHRPKTGAAENVQFWGRSSGRGQAHARGLYYFEK